MRIVLNPMGPIVRRHLQVNSNYKLITNFLYRDRNII